MESDHHLAEIAQKCFGWRDMLPYLIATESEEAEDAIIEDYPTAKRRRLVSS